MRSLDGIAELYWALRERQAPPLAWVVRWSDGGAREPVQAAWDACADRPVIMARLLEIARHPLAARAMSIAYDVGAINSESMRVTTERIRRLVPRAPGLRELLGYVGVAEGARVR